MGDENALCTFSHVAGTLGLKKRSYCYVTICTLELQNSRHPWKIKRSEYQAPIDWQK